MRLIDTEQLEHRRLYSAGGYSGYDCATWMSINMADEFDLETFEAEIRADERKKMKAIIGRTAENYGPVELGCAWYSLKLVDRIEKVIENYNLAPDALKTVIEYDETGMQYDGCTIVAADLGAVLCLLDDYIHEEAGEK